MGRRTHLAHRVSWEAHRGAIPQGMFVLHHCDNPPCVNPDHLFLGTQADNMADMVAKGRQGHGGGCPPGEQSPAAKITDAIVIEMRARAAGGEMLRDIAAWFGMDRSSVSRIVRGQSWSHVSAPTIASARARGERNSHAVLHEEDVIAIRSILAGNPSCTFTELGRRFGITPGSVEHIYRRKSWRHV